MTAQDYPVSFPYGATSAPYSPTRPHRGNDRPTPTGTPIVIGNKTIGLTGATGLVTGPHLHTQAGSDPQTQQTFNPGPYEFKPGKVTATGNASQWGNYITMQVPGGYITYAHLSQINVKNGDIIGNGGNMPITIGQQDMLVKGMMGRDPTSNELNDMNWRNNPGLAITTLWVHGSQARYKQYIAPETIKAAFKNFNVQGNGANGEPDAGQLDFYGNQKRGYSQLYEDLLKYNFNQRKATETENAKLKTEIDALKVELGKKVETDPDAIVITRTGFNGLFDLIKSWFSNK